MPRPYPILKTNPSHFLRRLVSLLLLMALVNYFLKKPEMISIQLKQVKKTIDEIKSKNPSADNAAKILFESFTP